MHNTIMGILKRFKKLKEKIREEEKYASPSEPRWIPASENQFGIDVLDCSSITQGMVAMTSDVKVAMTFEELRSSQGREYRDLKPEQCGTVAYELEYPPIQTPQDGPVFKATAMEDKWDIYLFNARLYFCRSWSGILGYRANIRSEKDKLYVMQIDYEKTRAENPLDAVRDVDYLIKSHLYGALVPHPLLRNVPSDPMSLAANSFSRFGQRCLYGTYDDTIKFKVRTTQHSGDANKNEE
ncbi:MAG: hypothetical protein P8Z37_12160 [Acidobacteriota bacterium]